MLQDSLQPGLLPFGTRKEALSFVVDDSESLQKKPDSLKAFCDSSAKDVKAMAQPSETLLPLSSSNHACCVPTSLTNQWNPPQAATIVCSPTMNSSSFLEGCSIRA
eukprot:2865779-Amphidinium_carterae.1